MKKFFSVALFILLAFSMLSVAYAAGPYRYLLEGFDPALLDDPSVQTPQYISGRIFEYYYPSPNNMNSVINEIRSRGLSAQRASFDEIYYSNMGQYVDVIKAATVDGAGETWIWLPASTPHHAPAITVTNPNSYALWTHNSQQTIQWHTRTPSGTNTIPVSASVRLDLIGSAGSNYVLLSSTSNDGSETIIVPSYVLPGFYKVRASSSYEGIPVTDDSDDFIEIRGPNNAPSIFSCSNSGSTTLGSSSSVSYSISDPEGHSFTTAVNWGDGTSSAGGASSASHTYGATGTYSLSITATDSQGASSTRNCGSLTINAAPNNPPNIASCTAPASATTGMLTTISYSISDPEGHSFTTAVNWGDGTSSAGGLSSASHTYFAAGSYSVTITATDSLGMSSTRNCGVITVTSNNPPNIASCTAPASGTIGNTVTLSYSISDPEGHSFTTVVNWGDGTTSTGGASSATHIYSAAGTYSISITSTDSLGAASSRNCGTITVTNVPNNPPNIASCTAPASVSVGTTATISYSISDPEGHSFTVTVIWGDGTSSTGGASSASHVYSAPGTYAVTITATDSLGASSSRNCGTITVTPVANNPPTINTCNSPGTVTLGTTATLTYSITDPEGHSFTTAVNWGDGTTSTGGASSATHIYAATGTYSVVITSTDSLGASSSRNCGTITVTNVPNNPPNIVSCSNSGSAVLGATSSVSYSITDPEGNPFTTNISWGDGTTSTGGASSASHTYASAGTYTISVTATDSLGSAATSSCGSLTISTAGPPGPGSGSTCGFLDISRVRAEVDSRSDSNVRDGDEISEEARPGSNVKIRVELENTFNNTGPDIEDITVTATLEGIDDGDDIEDESNEFDLRPGDDKQVTFRFDVPDDAEDGSYDITIEAEGEDENSREHDCDFDIELEVEREEHDLDITEVIVRPNPGNCTNGASAQIRIVNSGQNDETAAIEVTGLFGYVQRFENIFISSEQGSNAYSSALKLKFQQELDEGQNMLTFNVYGTGNTILDTQSVEVTGARCLKSRDTRTPVLSGQQPKIQGKESTLVLSPAQSSSGLRWLFEGSNTFWKRVLFYILMFLFIMMLIIILLLGVRTATEDDGQ
jgi:PKD repeat protein